METDNEHDAVRSLNLAKEFGLKTVLCGGKEAWKQSARALKLSQSSFATNG